MPQLFCVMPQKFQLTLIEELTFPYNIMSNGNDVLVALSMRNNLISALLLGGEFDQGSLHGLEKYGNNVSNKAT